MPKVTCSLCGSAVEPRQMVAAQKLDNHTLALIKKDRPEWEGKRGVCNNCLEQYRAKKFLGYLEAEYEKISALEESLVSKLARRGRVAKLVNEEYEKQMTAGQRVADKVARVGGGLRRGHEAVHGGRRRRLHRRDGQARGDGEHGGDEEGA